MKKPKLSDKNFETLERLINSTIHELVFVCQFAGDDDIDSALNALMTAQGNLEQIAEEMLKRAA